MNRFMSVLVCGLYCNKEGSSEYSIQETLHLTKWPASILHIEITVRKVHRITDLLLADPLQFSSKYVVLLELSNLGIDCFCQSSRMFARIHSDSFAASACFRSNEIYFRNSTFYSTISQIYENYTVEQSFLIFQKCRVWFLQSSSSLGENLLAKFLRVSCKLFSDTVDQNCSYQIEGRFQLQLKILWSMLLEKGLESTSILALVVSEEIGTSLKYLKTHSVKLYQLENPLHLHTSMIDSRYSLSWFLRLTFSY